MGDKSKIQWTAGSDGSLGATWNPVVAFDKRTGKRGWFCTKVSPGCTNCYAETINTKERFGGNGLAYTVPNLEKVRFQLVNLDQPKRWKKPRKIFVSSMTDTFHESFDAQEIIIPVIQVARDADWHTFQFLTKRPERMLEIAKMVTSFFKTNMWLGTSIENQNYANYRLKFMQELKKVLPDSILWVSYEPALENVDWVGWEHIIKWIVVGGESGKEARPFDVQWARNTINWCKQNGVACFVKQLGRRPYQTPESDGETGYFWELKDSHGGNWEEWPDDLRVREFPRQLV